MGKAKLPKVSEEQIQNAIVELLTLVQKRCQFLFFSVPNEALGRGRDRTQNAIRMARLKRMGLYPGAADLVLVHKGMAYFLEVKTASGKMSENQKGFAQRAFECGSRYVIVRSTREAARALKGWGILDRPA